MNKVFFLNSWNEHPTKLLNRYSKQTPGQSGVWKDIVGVPSINEADYCVILGGTRLNFNFDPKKTIYIKREPNFIQPDPPGLSNAVLWKDSHCGITWWINKNYDELKELQYSEKRKQVSCIVSTKHAHRLSFVKKMMKDNNGIDLYGRGHQIYDYQNNYKGALEYDRNCKFLGLEPYKYSIVLENSQEKNYWTEKLADAFLSWCMPIYWGCPNLNDFFEPQSYKTISLNDPNPIKTIQEIVSTPLSKNEIQFIANSRNKILDNYNIWEIVRKKIQIIKKD
jgi:hypothetical protein